MPKNKKRAIFLIICILNLVIVSCELFDIESNPQINQPAPDFTLVTLGGKEVQLSQFRGKPVLVNFWATWCQPCIEEMQLLQNRFEKHFPDLAVLAIEDGSSTREVSKIASKNKTTFLILRGTEDVLRQYGVNALPTTFLIDAEGVIRSAYVGSFTPRSLDTELKKVGIEK
jgi:peroxiredoxin